MTDTLTLQESHELYRKTHEAKPSIFKGNSLHHWIPEISTIVRNSNIKTVLDYDCGKAVCWKNYNLGKMWKLDRFQLYDPGVSEYSTLTDEKHDLVICIDVLEHVPKQHVDTVLKQIIERTNKLAFLSISTRLASKKLVDGSNAHATVEKRGWWLEKLSKYDKLIIANFD